MLIRNIISRVATTARGLTYAGVAMLSVLAAACADSKQPTDSGSAPAAAVRQDATAKSLFPTPLSAADADRYRRIFTYQEKGDWQQANREIANLDSKLLLGHVQFQRYMHPTAYRASYPELSAWLQRYNDHPAAYRAYSLANRRQPAGAAPLQVPVFGQEHLRHLLGERRRTVGQVQTAAHRRTAQTIRARIARSHLTVATRMIDRSGLPPAASDRLRAQVALGWLALGKDDQALKIAATAAERSRDRTSVPDWVAGLAAFQNRKFDKAERHFGLHAKSKLAGDWNQSAGAFWAARSAMKNGRNAQATQWLKQAAQHPYTFYGQLALEQLGQSIAPAHHRSRPMPVDIGRLQKLEAGRRVFGLIQAGQIWRADEELLQLLSNASPPMARSITAIAEAANLPQAAMRGAYYLASMKDTPATTALYPLPDWQPQGGFALDRALIWAFVRQESVFNPMATSGAGARGLMQLMPSTANYVAGDGRFEGARRDALYEPTLNLSLDQQYLRYLMAKDLVANDLFRLAVAYNAGIGNLHNWRREGLLASDPLMFIETLPLLETRLFVERVLANYWIYRALMGQPRPSLQALLKGEWPQYRSQEAAQVELAEDRSHGNR